MKKKLTKTQPSLEAVTYNQATKLLKEAVISSHKKTQLSIIQRVKVSIREDKKIIFDVHIQDYQKKQHEPFTKQINIELKRKSMLKKADYETHFYSFDNITLNKARFEKILSEIEKANPAWLQYITKVKENLGNEGENIKISFIGNRIKQIAAGLSKLVITTEVNDPFCLAEIDSIIKKEVSSINDFFIKHDSPEFNEKLTRYRWLIWNIFPDAIEERVISPNTIVESIKKLPENDLTLLIIEEILKANQSIQEKKTLLISKVKSIINKAEGITTHILMFLNTLFDQVSVEEFETIFGKSYLPLQPPIQKKTQELSTLVKQYSAGLSKDESNMGEFFSPNNILQLEDIYRSVEQQIEKEKQEQRLKRQEKARIKREDQRQQQQTSFSPTMFYTTQEERAHTQEVKTSASLRLQKTAEKEASHKTRCLETSIYSDSTDSPEDKTADTPIRYQIISSINNSDISQTKINRLETENMFPVGGKENIVITTIAVNEDELSTEEVNTFKDTIARGKLLSQDQKGSSGIKLAHYGNWLSVRIKDNDSRLICVRVMLNNFNVYIPHKLVSHKEYESLLNTKKSSPSMLAAFSKNHKIEECKPQPEVNILTKHNGPVASLQHSHVDDRKSQPLTHF